MKKNLIFISSEWMYDVDMPLLPVFAKKYNIHYFFYSNPSAPRVTKKEVVDFAGKCGLKLYWKNDTIKMLSPYNIVSYYKLSKEIKALSPEIIIRQEANIYWFIIDRLFLRLKTIYFIHDVKVHSGTHNGFIRQLFSDITIKYSKYFVLFSKSQFKLFQKMYRHKICLQTNLSVKDFGSSNVLAEPFSTGIKLLFFGRIEYNKGLDILIEKLELLFHKGIHNISLTICGKGSYWEECAKHIQHPQYYNLNVRYIPNDEIPDIFSSHHFLVLPYRDATQSGPLMIAANYGIPLLASNQDSFKEIYNDKNAIFYDSPEDLEKTLYRISIMDKLQYAKYVEACKVLKKEFSGEKIASDILNFIEEKYD